LQRFQPFLFADLADMTDMPNMRSCETHHGCTNSANSAKLKGKELAFSATWEEKHVFV